MAKDRMTEAFWPSILLSETHFPYSSQRGVIAEAVARVVEQGFYRSVDIGYVAEAADRRRIGELVRANDLLLTQWTSMVLTAEKLNLSSPDEELRARSVGRVKACIEPAVECGASGFAVLSGPDPGPALRAEATDQLVRSLLELGEALACVSSIRLVLEPLDRGAHKNALIGPTSESIALMNRIRPRYPDAGLSWDTAHAALCGEDILESLAGAVPYIAEIHLANAVLDRREPDFGDHHMAFGARGFLNVERIAALFERAVEAGLFFKRKPCVAVEIRTGPGADPWATEAQGRRILTDAWGLFQSRRPGI